VRRLFVSDTHLAEPDSVHFNALTRLLERMSAGVDEVYLLGDLCEVWVGDDDDGPLARAFVAVLAAASRRARVRVMCGNRDFLFGKRFEQEAGVQLIEDPTVLSDGIVVAHGDAFCIDDTAYQEARRMLRSPQWQKEVLSRPLADRRALAESMRAQSRASNANKAENIMDVADAEVDRVMAELGGHTLIHGHTHRPGMHPAPWGRRYVLGAWERCGWYLLQDGSRLELRCIPLAAR
jgi:UDP-2,3-diacylglucosamine hydrolase